MQYKHLFFDWDHTLWDFETNSERSLTSIYYEFDLRRFGLQSPQHFIDTYKPLNKKLWTEFREGKIDAQTVKIKRFQECLKQFSLTDLELIRQIKSFYLEELPKGGDLMPNVEESLELLSKQYTLHIVTNGFLEVTQQKIQHSSIAKLFTTILSAEEVGVLKPNKKVFEEAFKRANATAKNSLFIGDNLIADIQGPKRVGMHQVFYNPNRQSHSESPTYEISDIKELIDLLLPTAIQQER